MQREKGSNISTMSFSYSTTFLVGFTLNFGSGSSLSHLFIEFLPNIVEKAS